MRSSFARTCAPAKTKIALSAVRKTSCRMRPSAAGSNGGVRHQLLRLRHPTLLQGNDHCHLLAIVGVLGCERDEQIGELMQETDAKQLDMNRRTLLAGEQQRRAPVQELLRATIDPHLDEVGVWDVQLDRTVRGLAHELQRILVDNQGPGGSRSQPNPEGHGVTGRRLRARVHRTSIGPKGTPPVRTKPPTSAGELRIVAAARARVVQSSKASGPGARVVRSAACAPVRSSISVSRFRQIATDPAAVSRERRGRRSRPDRRGRRARPGAPGTRPSRVHRPAAGG
jgi:hypothetical protein